MNKAKVEQQEIQRLQHALDERTAQLEAAGKELERFSYSVSHDLRAPLRAIEGFSKILLEDYQDKLDDDGKRFLKIIDASSRKLTMQLDDLLLLSRLGRQPLKPERINMKAMVADVWDELQPGPAREIKIKVNSLPDALGDVALVRQIWKELLENAIKFTALQEKTTVEISATTEPNRTIYCIKDNGVGFNMKSADKLFGVFQRMHTEEEFEGSGIGLAIVQRLVRRHSGEVWTEATVDEGAAFYFTLPRVDEGNQTQA